MNMVRGIKSCEYCTFVVKENGLVYSGRLFNKLNKKFHFVLDSAATDKTAKCSLYYTPETDGLSKSWNRGGAVFCNPPYGREIRKWVKKAYEEAQVMSYLIVLLIPARTDTAYFW